MSSRPAHPPDMPGVQQLGLSRGHEQVSLLGLARIAFE
jgi:hypothetical protein